MSLYVPAVLGDLDPEETSLVLTQELQRIADSIDYRTKSYANAHVTAAYSAGGEPYIFADATGGAFSIDLPNPNQEMEITVVKIDNVATVTLDAGSVNINGATTYPMASQYDKVTVYWDAVTTGPQWWIV